MNGQKTKQLKKLAFMQWLELNKDKQPEDVIYDKRYALTNEKDKTSWYNKSITLKDDGTSIKVAPSKGSPYSRNIGIPSIFQYKSNTVELSSGCYRKVYKTVKSEYKKDLTLKGQLNMA